MIIVAILGVLCILFVLGMQLGDDVMVANHFSGRNYNRERAYYIARSVIDDTLKSLPTSATTSDSLNDPWAQPLPVLPIDGTTVLLQVEDEERRFNLNSLVANGVTDPNRVAQLQRLMEALGANPNLANAIVDWEDPDSNVTTPGGAEAMNYPNYPCKNGPFDSVPELLCVQGITPGLFEGQAVDPVEQAMGQGAGASPSPGTPNGQQAQAAGAPGLKSVVTVRSNGQINVNTASAYVLRSISEDITPTVVQSIINRRTETPFKTLTDLLQVPGFDIKYMYRFQQLAGVQSAVFRVTAVVQAATGNYIARVYAQRAGGNWVSVGWEVHP